MLFIISGCTETFETQETIAVTDALVVDARLTDQRIEQSIYLSRTFAFDMANPKPEARAKVSIIDDLGEVLEFKEVSSGHYKSNNSIQLSKDRQYQLIITTRDNISYVSDFERLPENTPIAELEASRTTNDNGVEGVAIKVSSTNNSLSTNNFRYEFEETYKIIAPDFNPFEWDEVDYDFFDMDDDGWSVTIAERTEETRVCYVSSVSRDIILGSTQDLDVNNLKDFQIKFLSSTNPKIANRYSILVKQYHQNINAAQFYKSLEDFSSQEDLFSNTQTGSLESNISVQNEDALVLGYFDLSSYSEKRLFFDFQELFPNTELPPYLINCSFISKPSLYPEGFHSTIIDGRVVLDGVANSPLLDGVLAGTIAFVGENENYSKIDAEGNLDRAPFFVKPTGCVDCSVFGTNIKPEFWID